MQALKSLIDKASKVCGSDAALAVRLGVKPSVISMLRKNRSITPATAAELADIAGEDARQAAIDAIIEGTKGTRREGVMQEILGKAVAAGVAGVLAFSYNGDSIYSNQTTIKNNNVVNFLYIVECLAIALRSYARVLVRLPSGAMPPIPQLPVYQ